MTSAKPLKSFPPTETVDISNGLTLTPRISLHLTVHRADSSVSTLDEWKFKRSIIDYLKTSFSHPIALPEDDFVIRRFKDLNKRKREEPVARASIFIRDLGFVKAAAEAQVQMKAKSVVGVVGEADVAEALEKKYFEWRKLLVEKMDGMEVNLEGVRFKVSVEVPASDDLERMKKECEEFYAFENSRGYSRSAKQEPDTLIVRGVPSRWFAEPRVSSKPSMLVTHTIFSNLGKIRNLNVAEDNDLGKDADDEDGGIVTGLHCKIVVQFEKAKDFYDALKILCSRSLQKEGSRLKADYEVTWDKDGIFRSSRNHVQGRNMRTPTIEAEDYRREAPRWQARYSHYSPDNIRPKRSRE